MIKKILCLIMVSVLFCSCAKNKIVDVSNANGTNESKTDNKKHSKLLDDKNFLESLHAIRNERTLTTSIVKGDGTMVMNSMLPTNEYLMILKDAKTGKGRFIKKNLYGLEKEEKTYEDPYSNETITYSDIATSTIFYDMNGKEVGPDKKTYNSNFVLNDKLFVNDESLEYPQSRELYMYDTTNGTLTKTPKNDIFYFGNSVIFSSNPYGYSEEDDIVKEILICDENLNVIRKIDGCSFIGVEKNGNTEIGVISYNIIKNNNKELKDLVYGEDYTYKYNYIDSGFNFIFDEPVDSRAYLSDSVVSKIHNGDTEFDFDFSKLEKVGDDRPYSGFENYNDKVQAEKSKYDSKCESIKSKNEKYSYVDASIYKDKVLFFANYFEDVYDENFRSHADIYSIDEKLLMSVDDLNSVWSEQGLFLTDFKYVYDFDLNLVKEFDRETYMQSIDVNGTVFFADNLNRQYESYDHYNIYDEKLNLLYSNIVRSINYAYKDYLVLADDNSTKIIDKDNNLIKEFDRSFEIWGYYDESDYKTFLDFKTNRMGIIDTNYNIIIDNLKAVSGLEKDCFTFTNGFRYGLMDYDGNEICSFSIFNTMDEDSNLKDYEIGLVD